MAKEENNGRKQRAKWVIPVALLIIMLGILAGLVALLIDYISDFFWFNSLGYAFYYLQRLFYRYAVFIVVELIFFAVFYLNFHIALTLLRREGNTAHLEKDHVVAKLKRIGAGPRLVLAVLSLAMAAVLAVPCYLNWQTFLFYVFGSSAGVKDPVFNWDVSFYLFSYPVYTLLQKWLMLAFALLWLFVFLIYAVPRGFFSRKHPLSKAQKWHTSILLLLFSLLLIWGFALRMFGLVFSHINMPAFYGPGYVQMHVTLPLILMSMLLLAAVAVSLMVVIHRRRGYLVFVFLTLSLAVVLTLGGTQVLQKVVYEYIVQPNELSKETPYIQWNIAATLDAYKLNTVEYRDFRHVRFPEAVPPTKVRDMLRNIPVWDEQTLEGVYHQLQELRSYYTFAPISVTRYTVGGEYQQVFLSAREIDYANLPGSGQNWLNQHLTYTHGFGTVMVPASQEGGAPMTWFIQGVPPVSDYHLLTAQPRVYYGLKPYNYIIAPNGSGELDYPKGAENVMYNYQGNGGVPMGSLWKKALYAFYFKDKKLFFTTKTMKDSRILYRRNVLQRVGYIAPFLSLDATPYVAQTSSGIYWIIDAYTSSAHYPVSAPYLTKQTDYNYIRNSVKIIVNAFNGQVDFYVWDEKDPIINAYQRIYPGLFKNKSAMPEDLRAHVRYPKDIFNIQMRIYARYHQTDPKVFYHQEDLWTFADILKEGEIVTFKPYYLTLNIIQENRLDFLLLQPMMPKDRNNLRALAFAASDRPYYGKIIIYSFPKGELVYGPRQIDAVINQDPDISQLFTLWDQAGSSVQRGKMIILPFENSVFFIQPVYLISRSNVKIPELQRIIMSEGQVAVIESSLEGAYAALKKRIDKEEQQLQERYPALQPPSEGTPLPPGQNTLLPPKTNLPQVQPVIPPSGQTPGQPPAQAPVQPPAQAPAQPPAQAPGQQPQ